MPAVLGVFPTKLAAVSIPGSQILFRPIQCVPLIALDKETMYIFLFSAHPVRSLIELDKETMYIFL